MTENLEKSLMPNIDTAVGNLINPGTEVIGNVFRASIHKAFHRFIISGEKQKIDDKYDLMLYDKKAEIEYLKGINELYENACYEFNKIAPEDLIIPKVGTLASILNEARYCVEEPELRKMFSKLIAATAHQDKSRSVHPSYASLISKLSPLDAQNLKIIYKWPFPYPILNVYENISEDDLLSRYTYYYTSPMFLGNPDEQDLVKQASSLDNLERIGLVNFIYSDKYVEEDYLELENEFDALLTSIKNRENDPAVKLSPSHSELLQKKYGIIRLTKLGNNFARICMAD